jgi:hypothetical protein
LDDGIGAHRVAGEDQEGVVALREQAFEQLALLGELPLLRHAVVGRTEAEILHRVHAGLFPGREIRVRSARNERHLGGGYRRRQAEKAAAQSQGRNQA